MSVGCTQATPCPCQLIHDLPSYVRTALLLLPPPHPLLPFNPPYIPLPAFIKPPPRPTNTHTVHSLFVCSEGQM